ncbi:hypothetical protein [Mycolicibacterium septicum]|uniref:hypothetical protein n=1 Tax=Mycolicibacterium septicum TaxID=98668 RepID=UPI001AF61CF2|nr:hypothetical protein [Mycolicibacterium septicum]QRY51784.1 hypothetical protein JVX95_31160 [Mycolicibacterium septicum]
MSNDKLRITLYSTDNSVRSAIRTAFEGAGYHVEEVTDSTKMPRKDINEIQQDGAVGLLKLPDKIDGVITTSALNKRSEGLAATLGLKQQRNDVYVYVLPEALDFLRTKLSKAGELTLVGAEQSR